MKYIRYIAAVTLAFLLSFSHASAQNFTVGIPVDTIYLSFFIPNNTCGQDHTTSITFLPSTVTGVIHVLRVIQALPPNTIVEQMAGNVNTGDSFIFTQALNNFVFVTPVGSSFGITVRAIGTPQIASEPYGCELLLDDYFFDGCRFTYSALGFYDTCYVIPAPSVQELNGNGISIYPDPVSSWLKINGASENANILMTDLAGKIILRQTLPDSNTLYFEKYAPGIYLLNIQDGKVTFWKKIIKY